MGDFLPGVFQMIEDRFGRLGRPLTTGLLALFALAIASWCLGVVYKNVVGPILYATGTEIDQQLANTVIAWVTLFAFVSFIGIVVFYVRHRLQRNRYEPRLANKQERIKELEAEIAALRGDDGEVH